MKRTLGILAVLVTLVWAPVFAAEQNPIIERPRRVGPDVGFSLLAAAANLIYFPVRFAVTVVTSEVGGVSACLNGGDQMTAQAIWDSTEGQAFLTPRILEGSERLQFGQATYDD